MASPDYRGNLPVHGFAGRWHWPEIGETLTIEPDLHKIVWEEGGDTAVCIEGKSIQFTLHTTGVFGELDGDVIRIASGDAMVRVSST